ncbi:hypothetical protein SDC9_90524 [bioreactor metagenome]|uniref:Uncharacterized protein n=1 Tax=bioreactor metagenome TaxID=1076179 RepID=A0A644ZSW7_9ZZZZ
MKTAKYFLAAFRREVALNITDKKNQETQQYRNFNNVIKKELNAPDPAVV